MDAFQRLGIDLHSLLLYVVNFGLLAFILGRLLYKPLLRVLDERRDTIKGNLREAEELRAALDRERAERKEEAERMLAQIREEQARARAEAEAKAAALLAQADVRREEMMREAKELIAGMRARVYADVRDDVAARLEAALFAVVGKKTRVDAKALLDAAEPTQTPSV